MKAFPWILATVAISVLAWLWYHPIEKEIDGPVREITRTIHTHTTVTVSGGTVLGTGDTFITHSEAKNDEKEGLPVVATGTLSPSGGGGYDITATVTPETGKISLFSYERPLPLIGLENSKELGFRSSGGDFSVYGRWTFARVGNIHAAIYGEITKNDAAFAGIDLSYRW